MFCKYCGAPLAEHAVVCLNCGVKAGTGNKFCAQCGAQPAPEAIVCVKCGSPIRRQSMQNNDGEVNSFGGAIKSCFGKYATFRGRANRSEFWYWYLFTLLLYIIPPIGMIASLVVFIPNISVTVRRLHDVGKGGGWYFISLIPIVGWIWLLVLLCKASQEGENEYGPNPNV